MPAGEIIRVAFGFRIPMPGAVGNTSSRSFYSTLFGSIPADSYYNCPTTIVFMKIVEIFITALALFSNKTYIYRSHQNNYTLVDVTNQVAFVQRRIQGCPSLVPLYFLFLFCFYYCFFFFFLLVGRWGPS